MVLGLKALSMRKALWGMDSSPTFAINGEGAAAPAVEKGIRVVNLRTGIVLDLAGGTLARMLTPFKMGVGGKLGNGNSILAGWLWMTSLK